MTDFKPKIIAFCCNSAFFFVAKFFAGSGSQRNLGKSKISRGLEKPQFFIGTWGKKKLALTCSNFAFNINYTLSGGWEYT